MAVAKKKAEAKKAEEVSSGSSLLVNPSGQGSEMISLSLIDYDPKWNLSRQYVDEEHAKRGIEAEKNSQDFKELVSSLRTKGQLSNVVVRVVKGGEKPFRLVAGFRRTMAAEVLEWKEIRATITTQDERTAQQLNVMENVVRKEISRFQLATAAWLYSKEHKVPSEEVGREFGLSAPYVRALITSREALHHDILIAWADRNPDDREKTGITFATTQDKLNIYKALPPANQLAEFHKNALIGGQGLSEAEAEKMVKEKGFRFAPEGTGGGKGGRGRGSKGGKLLSSKVVKTVHKAISQAAEEGEMSPDTRRLYETASRTLAFVLQMKGSKKIQVGSVVIYDPEAGESENAEAKKS